MWQVKNTKPFTNSKPKPTTEIQKKLALLNERNKHFPIFLTRKVKKPDVLVGRVITFLVLLTIGTITYMYLKFEGKY
jgi:hypothetical protein